MITQVKEGTVLGPANNHELNEIAQKHFANKNFVYIANRAYEYNVSPVTYIETSKIENLLGMCIVIDTAIGIKTALFERKFYAKEFKVSPNLHEAILWAVALVDNEDR